MSTQKPRSMFGDNAKPDPTPDAKRKGVFADVVSVESKNQTELGGGHKTGMVGRRRKLVRILIVLGVLFALGWAVGAWSHSISTNISGVSRSAARNVDPISFADWFTQELADQGYEGYTIPMAEGAVDVSVAGMYQQILVSVVEDPNEVVVWDIEPLLVYVNDGNTYQSLPIMFEFPIDISALVKIFAAFYLLFGGLAIGLLGSAVFVARDGGIKSIAWTLRSIGWRFVAIGGVAAVWILWKTAKFADAAVPVDAVWLAGNLSNTVMGWDPVPFVVLGLVGVVIWGTGFVLRDQ